MENPIEPCTNNTMSDHDRSDVAVLENMEENDSGDETEVGTETSNNEVEQGHIRKIDKYNPSLDLPIALRKGTKSCTKHSISNYVSYRISHHSSEPLLPTLTLPQYRKVFTLL